jgi:tRNA threonylcarbamoyladenosine biosynthesis protein TsaE
MFKFVSKNETETKKLAFSLASRLTHGDIVILSGDLGSCKTKFTEGFLSFWNLEDEISSPTFTIVNEHHQNETNIYHFDVYRISGPWDMDDLGYEEYFYGDGVCMIEWGSMIDELLPANTIFIKIEKDLEKGFDYRKITISKDF